MKKIFKMAIVIVLLLFSIVLLSEAIESVGTVPSFKIDGCKGVCRFGFTYHVENFIGSADEDEIACFIVHDSTGTRYIRSVVLEKYEGGFWKLVDSSKIKYLGEVLPQYVSEFSDQREIWFSIQPLRGSEIKCFIPTTSNLKKLVFDGPLEYYENLHIFYSKDIVESKYNVSYIKYLFEEQLLDSLELSFEWVKRDSEYLQIPEELAEKIRPIAKEVVNESETSYKKIRSIIEFLKENYEYDSQYSKPQFNQDPVEYFLFESKGGVSVHFNSALVLLLRSMGIPARLVGGYLIDPSNNFQRVYSNQRHAYAEVPFKEAGWIIFDATPKAGCCSCEGSDEFEEGEVGEEGKEGIGEEVEGIDIGEDGEGDISGTEDGKECLLIDEVFNRSRCDDCVNIYNKLSVEGGLPPDVDLFKIFGSTGTSYLRTMVGEQYEGVWSMVDAISEPYSGGLIQQTVSNYSDASIFRFLVEPLVDVGGFIPSSSNPNELNINWPLIWYQDKQIFFSHQIFNSSYAVSYTKYDFDMDTLRRAKPILNPLYLEVPEDLLKKIRPLALNATSGFESSYDELRALESFLQTNYIYDLNYTGAPPDVDPVDWFLFYEKRGVCSNFNSAFVLLARSIGLPARLVSGYLINPTSEVQTVNASQDHAYSEVLFQDIGWIRFDATGGCSTCDLEQEEAESKIATFTEITYQDSVCLKGYTFNLVGEVRDPLNKPVDGLDTLVYLKEVKNETGLLVGKGVVMGGKFNITCNLPLNVSIGDYLIQVHTISDDRYNESWSDPPLRVMSETQIGFTLPKKVISSRPFTFNGNLTELMTSVPIPNSTCILDTGDGVIQLKTNNKGLLKGSYRYSEPGNYSFCLRWLGSTYYLNTSFSSEIRAIPLIISPDTSSILVRKEEALLSGKVHADELVGNDEEFTLSINRMEIGTVISDEEGNFTYYYTVPSRQELGEICIGFYLKSNSFTTSMQAIVFAKTELGLEAPGYIVWGKPFNISARLTDDLGEPIRNANLTLEYYYKESRHSINAITDFSGTTVFPLKLRGKPPPDTISYNVSYGGHDYYLSSIVNGSFDVIIPQKRPFIVQALLLAIVSISGFMGFMWFKRRNRKIGAERDDLTDELDETTEETEVDKKGEETGIDLRIEFPQIVHPFPLVWGVEDKLRVRLHLHDRDGTPIRDGNIILRVNEREETILTIDENGVSEVWKTFHQKGVIRIMAYYPGNADREETEHMVDLKIVDYREEIEDLFNEKFEKFCSQKEEIKDYFTAREFQAALIKEVTLAHDSLEEMVTLFEFADYSIKDIKRGEYERFYLAKQEFELITDGQRDS